MKKIKSIAMILVIGLIALGMNSCGKYEDGPSFTLSSKTSRLSGIWKVLKYDGMDMVTPWLKEFEKDGYYRETVTILSKDIVYEGTWSFENNKEVVQVKLQGNSEDYTITRLTDEEFWYKDIDGKVWELGKQ